MGTQPKTFDEGVVGYAQAIRMAYQEDGDIEQARAKVRELRAFILTLPTNCGVNKHFRLDQIEAKALSQQPTITESAVSGESHD